MVITLEEPRNPWGDAHGIGGARKMGRGDLLLNTNHTTVSSHRRTSHGLVRQSGGPTESRVASSSVLKNWPHIASNPAIKIRERER